MNKLTITEKVFVPVNVKNTLQIWQPIVINNKIVGYTSTNKSN